MPGAWPNSQVAAAQAVAESRQARGMENADAAAAWGPEDLVSALDARLPLVKGALCAFKTGVQKLNETLWPKRVPPVLARPLKK